MTKLGMHGEETEWSRKNDPGRRNTHRGEQQVIRQVERHVRIADILHDTGSREDGSGLEIQTDEVKIEAVNQVDFSVNMKGREKTILNGFKNKPYTFYSKRLARLKNVIIALQ